MKKFTKYPGNKVEAARQTAKQPVMAAESYGWVVESWEAQDAYDFACEYFGEEDLNKQIIQAIDSDELAACLAYIFRMNDFQEWYNRDETEE